MSRYFLAIDWGSSKVGVALANEESRIAHALEEISPDDLIDKIQEIDIDYGVEVVVFGLVEGENSQKIDQVAKQVENCGFEIDFIPELFSTQLAQRNLIESGKKNISKRDNAESARIILQDWLDNN